MGMSLDEVYEHYNSLNPQRQISLNTPDSIITTTTYSSFKTICALTEVRMAEFKVPIFENMNEFARLVGNTNTVIRLGKKGTYFEVYDVMFAYLTEDHVMWLENVMDKHKLFDLGYSMLVLEFVLPKKDDEEEPSTILTAMLRYIPETENTSEFFGYII